MDIAAIDGTLLWILGPLLVIDLVALGVRWNTEYGSDRAFYILVAVCIVVIGLLAYLL